MKKLVPILLPILGLLAVVVCFVVLYNSPPNVVECTYGQAKTVSIGEEPADLGTEAPADGNEEPSEPEEEYICAYEAPKTFSSVEEMSSFFAEGGKHRALSFDPAEVTSLVVPNVKAFKEKLNAELHGIGISGNYVNFSFSVKGVDLEALAEEYEIPVERIDTREMSDEELEAWIAEQQKRLDNNEILWDQLADYAATLDFTTTVYEDGEEILENFTEMNPVEKWEEHPEFTYTPAPNAGMKHTPGYMLYWSANGKYMQAYMPTQLLDAFWEAYPELFEIKKFR